MNANLKWMGFISIIVTSVVGWLLFPFIKDYFPLIREHLPFLHGDLMIEKSFILILLCFMLLLIYLVKWAGVLIRKFAAIHKTCRNSQKNKKDIYLDPWEASDEKTQWEK